jgi:hypothetical protein
MGRLRVLVAGVLVALGAAGGALAHGDPTSHYLERENFLTTYASPPASTAERRLRGLLEAAAASGYPIKVSLIASDGDTGGDTAPLEHTQWYAERVGEQLEAIRPLRAPVLVVTPHVIGVGGNQLRDGRLQRIDAAGARALVRGVPVARRADGTALARSAMAAVRRIARAGGHPLPRSVPPSRRDLDGSVLAGVAAGHEAQDGGWSTSWVIALLLGTVAVLAVPIYAVSRLARRSAGRPAA